MDQPNADEIFSIGTGPIYKGNLAQAKEKALSQALAKGMEDYLIRRLGTEGMANNFQRLVEEIIPGAGEEIENYCILAEAQSKGEYKILVRLRINKKVVDEKLRRAGLVIMKGPAVKVLFMVSETHEEQSHYWWKYPEEPSAMSAIELALYNAFQERGFNPVNRTSNIPEVSFSENMRSAELQDESILTWGRLFHVDVVICGRTGLIDGKEGKEVFLTLKAIATDSGDLLCEGSDMEPIQASIEDKTQISEHMINLVNHLASRFAPVIVQALVSGRQKLHTMEVTLAGLKTYRQFVDFRNFLLKEVPGVKAVKQTRVKKDAITVEVKFEGDENKFRNNLMNNENLPPLRDLKLTEDGKLLLEVE